MDKNTRFNQMYGKIEQLKKERERFLKDKKPEMLGLLKRIEDEINDYIYNGTENEMIKEILNKPKKSEKSDIMSKISDITFDEPEKDYSFFI